MPTESPSSIQKRAWMAWVRRASESPTRKARTSSDFGRLTARRAVPSRAMPRPRARDGRRRRAHPQFPTMRQPPEIANVCTAASPPMLSMPGPGGCRSSSCDRSDHRGHLRRGVAGRAGRAARPSCARCSSQATDGHLEGAGVGRAACLQAIGAAGLRDGAGEAVGEARLVVDRRPDGVEALHARRGEAARRPRRTSAATARPLANQRAGRARISQPMPVPASTQATAAGMIR